MLTIFNLASKCQQVQQSRKPLQCFAHCELCLFVFICTQTPSHLYRVQLAAQEGKKKYACVNNFLLNKSKVVDVLLNSQMKAN